jgi:hypothetical protein
MDETGLIIASPTSFLIFVLLRAAAPIGFLLCPPILLFVFLALHTWRLLLSLWCPWLLLSLWCPWLLLSLWCPWLLLWSRRLLLRSSLLLLRSPRLLRRGAALNAFTTSLRWLRMWTSRSALLQWRWTLGLLLSLISHRRRFLSSPLSRCDRSLFILLL